MKRSIFSLPVFLLHALLLFLLPMMIESDNLIEKTCKKTPYYDLCVSSLQSNPQSSNTDVRGLASIMGNITLSDATNTLNYIQELINQTTDPELERPLTHCAELYISVVDYILPQAMEALANGHYGFAKYGISDAGEEAHSCEKKTSGLKLPLTEMNKVMQNLHDIAVAIINTLLNG
ncbi:hypothetical protein P3X46_005836 [Hevea brasiliensis]|uniref:Pectinesterase inhibitor domain-containing protein n=1 Tax=Hevea brasiliensis TaxID=3981 RepID=A0ABQ9MS86_HEVBR|nr:cell wall / vacuolar inhibitor of fructosidase 1-like [Hevea brasiliensis]KAJ9181778.1 hypothetical protein P3X46_005836 [Hevea brasiliensis]